VSKGQAADEADGAEHLEYDAERNRQGCIDIDGLLGF